MDKEFLRQFHNSYVTNAHQYLGSHYNALSGSVLFRVYAPHAERVSVVGDFNSWNIIAHPMHKIDDSGIWETTISSLKIYENYKYCITNKGKTIFKQDPYAFHSETNGNTCSKVFDIDTYVWQDSKYFEGIQPPYHQPINIYEVHLGSWKRKKNYVVYNYREIARLLIAYVKKMGYTHIEIMPITEYPFDGSWGYQVTGYFSITSRYGLPTDFMYLVDYAHQNGIGVILDWVPAHFPKDDFGLYEFDGEDVYEDSNPTRREHRSWGTRIFNYAKPEVKSFLISSAKFFFEKYHIDGLRVDAVASMLYLDYDREEWEKNCYGNNHNLEAIAFLQALNTEIFKIRPNALMIAEESTDFANVTKPVYMNGLGFNFKWNMGWMNDSIKFIQTDPLFRGYNQNQITFSLTYAFSENFVLPISHDEVVHGKKSLLDKMPGEYDQKFANERAFLGYMMCHPGKKLNFMGYEIAQFIEWDYKKGLDWSLLYYERHHQMKQYVHDLNHLYLKSSELWEIDDAWEGFSWINLDDTSGVVAFKRTNRLGQSILIIFNYSGAYYDNYAIGVEAGTYQEIFSSDSLKYGGGGVRNAVMHSRNIPMHNMNDSIAFRLAPTSILMIKRRERRAVQQQNSK